MPPKSLTPPKPPKPLTAPKPRPLFSPTSCEPGTALPPRARGCCDLPPSVLARLSQWSPVHPAGLRAGGLSPPSRTLAPAAAASLTGRGMRQGARGRRAGGDPPERPGRYRAGPGAGGDLAAGGPRGGGGHRRAQPQPHSGTLGQEGCQARAKPGPSLDQVSTMSAPQGDVWRFNATQGGTWSRMEPQGGTGRHGEAQGPSRPAGQGARAGVSGRIAALAPVARMPSRSRGSEPCGTGSARPGAGTCRPGPQSRRRKS